MPDSVSSPGVFIEEVPSGGRTVVGVPTSITAFVGSARRGPLNEPVRIQDYASFERAFGGLWERTTLGHAVSHFFLNGGSDAVIVRVANGAVAASAAAVNLSVAGTLTLTAANPGEWGNRLRVRVTHPSAQPATGSWVFNLTVRDTLTGQEEVFRNLSLDLPHTRNVSRVLAEGSQLVRAAVDGTGGAGIQNVPVAHPTVAPSADPFADDPTGLNSTAFTGGGDGADITDGDVVGSENAKTGLYALENADLFNLMCIPPLTPGDTGTDVGVGTWDAALTYCKSRRAMLIVDAPGTWTDPRQVAASAFAAFAVTRDSSAAVFFPRVRLPDPLKGNRLDSFAPCGAVAGVFARTDTQRGVWKAPAGRDAALIGVQELSVKMTDPEIGLLNSLGVNCLRTFPQAGSVVWGARTLRGADELVDQWKYIPVRRLALFIEETLDRNTRWAAFEPNDEPLWAQVRLSVGAFMQDLFREGAFQGRSPREAYLVKCDRDTTPQSDIDRGVVNIVVGFAPLKPAEFVVINIRQLAGTARA